MTVHAPPISSGIPLLVDHAFQALQAWAAGDVAALQNLATSRFRNELEANAKTKAQWLDTDGWRGAAIAWVNADGRKVMARTDGELGYARFHAEDERLFVLIFRHENNVPRLDGARDLPEADFRTFGELV
jgi:hypothetical protein